MVDLVYSMLSVEKMLLSGFEKAISTGGKSAIAENVAATVVNGAK